MIFKAAKNIPFGFSSKGQSATEFALALPLILMLAAGATDFGILYYNQQRISAAAGEALVATEVADPFNNHCSPSGGSCISLLDVVRTRILQNLDKAHVAWNKADVTTAWKSSFVPVDGGYSWHQTFDFGDLLYEINIEQADRYTFLEADINVPVPFVFGKIIGLDTANVHSSASAYATELLGSFHGYVRLTDKKTGQIQWEMTF